MGHVEENCWSHLLKEGKREINVIQGVNRGENDDAPPKRHSNQVGQVNIVMKTDPSDDEVREF